MQTLALSKVQAKKICKKDKKVQKKMKRKMKSMTMMDC